MYGHGYPNVDAAFSLMWGQDLLSGDLPDYTGGPTPHPLSNLAGLVLSPLGSASEEVLLAASYVFAGALVWATGLVASRLFGPLSGIVAAILIFSRDVVSFSTAQAILDIPFAALVVSAIAMEVRRPRLGRPVLVVLGIAGLLRPEAWFLAGFYWLWVLPTVHRAEAIRLAALVAAAPAIWLLLDFAVTGNPLWGFTHTAAAASRVPGAATGLEELITQAPGLLANAVRPAVVLVAVAGLVLSVMASRAEGVRAAGITAAVTLAAAIPAAAGSLIQTRYVIPTVAMLCVFAGAAVGGWQHARRLRRPWVLAATASGVVLAAGVPGQADLLKARRDGTVDITRNRATLETLVKGPLPCSPVIVPNGRLVPVVAVWRQVDPNIVVDRSMNPTVSRGVYVFGSRRAMHRLVVKPARDRGKQPLRPPPKEATLLRSWKGWEIRNGCNL